VRKPSALAAYDAALALSRQMLEAAANSRWDDLIALEQKRAALLAGVESGAIAGLEDAGLQQRLANVIQQILESDSQIKTLVEAWTGELSGILHSMGTEKKLQQAYDTK